MRRLIFPGLFFLLSTCLAQEAKTVRLADLQKLMNEKSEKIQVINFWATWCGPCVKELPVFEKLRAEGRPDVKVTLVSLDLDLDPNPAKVYRFISKKNIQAQVLLLDEPDANSWISKIDKEWSGALPATILINHKTGKRRFVGRALEEGELETYLREIQ
ncbi:MAG TPA: TlpA disulfide reductase family protein [Chryseosolibacter sp.]